jgi:hypothetical protein
MKWANKVILNLVIGLLLIAAGAVLRVTKSEHMNNYGTHGYTRAA